MECQLYKREDEKWDWRIRADNGLIIATSGGQGFNERNDAKESVILLKANLVDLEFVYVPVGQDG